MLSKEEVQKIAKLSRLYLSETEIEGYQKKLSRVLEAVHSLSKIADLEKGYQTHASEDTQGLRQDTAEIFTNREVLLSNAPSLEENQFKVPTVVEDEA